MCEAQAEQAAEDPEIWGEVTVRNATVFGKWPEPVCDEHDRFLTALGIDLEELEKQEPDIAKLGQQLRDGLANFFTGRGCTDSGCLIVSYRCHSDNRIVATHVHMESDDKLRQALEETGNAMTKQMETAGDGPT
jgi:hypothetical protein